MTRSLYSQHSATQDDPDAEPESRPETPLPSAGVSGGRRLRSARVSELDLRARLPSRLVLDERSSLLANPDGPPKKYSAAGQVKSARSWLSRHNSGGTTPVPRHHSRASSWGVALSSAIRSTWRRDNMGYDDAKGSLFTDERVWYDQYTSTDWVHDSIADNFRVHDLRRRKDVRGRIWAWFDGGEGWLLVALVGAITACVAYFVDITETAIFDIKEGYCADSIYASKKKCCLIDEDCPLWRTWGDTIQATGVERETIDFIFYVLFVIVFSVASSLLVLATKTTVQSPVSLPTLDENLAAEAHGRKSPPPKDGQTLHKVEPISSPPRTYYPAAGSGVAEVKVILSGFVVHGYLGAQTLVIKTIGLILSVASGLSLGKEGPFVHIATCVGNISCRLFSKYNHNDGKRREILSASAASGVAVAFGAPIAGVLFSLEEVSYYFPPKTLFRTFFCCIVAALSLKFLNPYGTGKIVIFEVRYESHWASWELLVFILLGILGGALGALFIKASKVWARTFRKITAIKRLPILEVALVALITGAMSFWNRYTKLAVTELMFELASPCKANDKSALCPRNADQVKDILGSLVIAFLIKSFLTTITFGIKVPAGIYVPSMVVGGFMGRIIGHALQYLVFTHPDASIWSSCRADGASENCITPGVYALVAAGSTMCGVTRLSVTLAVILFELTGSLDHVLPFSLSVLVAKWTADAVEPLSIYVRRHSPDSLLPTVLIGSVGSSYRDEFLSFPGLSQPADLHIRARRYYTTNEG